MAEKEYLERAALEHQFMTKRQYLTKDMVMDAAYEINKFPAADVAPVVHGRWIKTIRENGCAEWTDFTCSVCGSVFDGNDWLFSEWKGCPVCLAKMDLEGGNT